jgi:hypothetical protein
MPDNKNDAQAAVVEAADKVHEVKSEPVAEAKLRHEFAQSEYATPQEKRQAATELADVNAARPDGSYAQLHATDEPRVHVADEARVSELKKDQEEALKSLEGSAPANSPAGVQQEEDSAKARRSAAQAEDARTSGQASAGKSSAAQSK